jgi:hypothetical protein
MGGGDDRARRFRGVTVAALALIAVGCTIGVAVPAGLGWDFANFYDAGHRVAAGQAVDLYHQDRSIDGQPPQGRMRFWSAPLSAAIFAPLSLLRPERALIAFKIQNVAALAAAIVLLYRHCRTFAANGPNDRPAFAATFAVFCLIYQPFWTVFRVGGQSTPTVLLVLVAAMFSYMASRRLAAALLLVAAAMIKPTLVVVIAFLTCVSGISFAAALVTAGLSLGALSVATLGWPIHREFLGVLVEGSRLSRPWFYNSSLYVPIENVRLLMLAPETVSAAATALSVAAWCIRGAVVAMFVVILRRSRRSEWTTPARRHFEFIMAICFWLLTSQTIWEHYLAMLFVPLCYLAAVQRWFPKTAAWMLAAIFVLSLGQNLVVIEFIRAHIEIRSVVPLVGIGLVKAGPLVLTMILLWRYQDSLFASYRAPEWAHAAPGLPAVQDVVPVRASGSRRDQA